MTQIKICGITREEDAVACAGLGADYIGFVFVRESPRYVEPETARRIVESIGGRAPRSPLFVGVCRNESPDVIREVMRIVGLDLVQLHGEETDDHIAQIGVPVVKAIRVGGELPDVSQYAHAGHLLFDTLDARQAGGTGRRFDWSLLSRYDRTKPFFLAGGIDAENVAVAIAKTRPDAIDVSSGVERAPGIKDHEKLRTLFERVRRP